MTKPTYYQRIKPLPDPLNPRNFLAVIDADPEKWHLERRTFSVKTYSELRKNISNWSRVSPANDILSQLDGDEYDYVIRLFVRVKRDIDAISDRTSLMTAITAIDGKIEKTFGKLNLTKRIQKYVMEDKRIVMPSFVGVGFRLQDTPPKTFLEHEYHLINSIVVISKLLFPIFGELIKKVQYVEDTWNGNKEIVTFGIIKTLMSRDFSAITQKLLNYIATMVDSALTDDPMLTFHGITEMGLTYDKLAKMIVKNFVNHDLYQEGGNIMRYIAVTIKRTMNTETSGASKSIAYKPLMMSDRGDDGRNVSLLENSVSTSSEAIEIPIIVKIAVDRFTTDYIVQNNIKKNFFDSIVSFYKVTTLPPTPINELVTAMFVADPIGSAYCVKYMNMGMMVNIISIIQIYAMKIGFNSIVPLFSMIPTNITKTESDEVDNAIIISEGRGDSEINHYINLREATSHLNDFGHFKFEELMDSLFNFVVNNVFSYNVAPKILELGNTGNTIDSGGIVKYDRNIISDLHSFLFHLLMVADPARKI